MRLALSLHAATDSKRSTAMPINNKHDLSALGEAIGYYLDGTKRRCTIQYVLLAGR